MVSVVSSQVKICTSKRTLPISLCYKYSIVKLDLLCVQKQLKQYQYVFIYVFGSNGINTLMRCQRKYKFKVVNMGVKLFCKNRDNKSPAQYRLLQEGLEILMPYMSDDRKIPVSKLLFAQFLDKFNFTQDELAKMGHAEQFAGRDQGSAVMVCGGDLYVTIWIGVNNVSLMIGKEEIKSFKFLLINQLE